jgi:hypothetical protein
MVPKIEEERKTALQANRDMTKFQKVLIKRGWHPQPIIASAYRDI